MHRGHSETSEVFCFLMIAINENENALYYMKKSHFNIILIVYDSVWIWLVCCVEKMQLDVEMSQPAFKRCYWKYKVPLREQNKCKHMIFV